MRNWPKSKRTIWQSLRIKATRRIFQFAEGIENPKRKILKNLKDHATFNLHVHESELIACPENLEVSLNKIGFADLFFSEEFDSLQKGLNRLLTSYPYSSLEGNTENLNAWFNDIRKSASTNAASIYVGSILFDKKARSLLKLVHSAQIWLHYLDSSFIILSIFVNPSTEFLSKFSQISKSIPYPQSEILGFSFRDGITASSRNPTQNVKQLEFEEIFLELNKSIVIFFRKTFNAGLSSFGPLPCIEVINFNVPLREIPEKPYLPKFPPKLRASCQFLRSLGYPFDQRLIYKSRSWWIFYEVSREKLLYENSSSYQVLMSLPDYKVLKSEASSDDKESMFGIISYRLHELFPLLALEHFYKVLKSMTIELKNELEPALKDQIKGRIHLRTLEVGISKMTRVNGFHFHNSRMGVGINEKFLLYFINRGAEGLSRKKHKEEGSVFLAEDVKYRIDQDKKFCEGQLSLLKLAYSQILSSKSLTLNYLLQRNTLILSIVVAVLTVITLLPENTRKILAIKLWNLLINLF
ncbi:MAG: hypothetical protein KME12_21820 [Trichocoleus desertorum ATA4-8-CV12]|jgi:hypothetical protein|nr:hypothetical protein [Trichocoleus desertorum ATA4-8-CV12]